MSVKLRLKRMGRKKVPFFRVVAIDSRNQRDGLELERLGVYNPVPEEEIFNVKEDRIFYWLEQGAEVSDTVHNLMRNHGLALKWHLKQQGASEEEIEREYQKWQLLRESKASAKAEQQKRAAEEVKKAAEKEEVVEESVAEEAEVEEDNAEAAEVESETVAEENAEAEAETADDEAAEEEPAQEEAPEVEDTTEVSDEEVAEASEEESEEKKEEE